MSDRKEYLKKYRLEHKEKYREYQRKYRGTHLSTYEKLQQENQELKRNCNIGYENLNFYRQENQELKKQLHEASIGIQELIEQDIECPSNCSKLKEILNQQKKFIEYLTSYIDLLSNKPDLIEENQKDILEEILSKYREIIGGKE